MARFQQYLFLGIIAIAAIVFLQPGGKRQGFFSVLSAHRPLCVFENPEDSHEDAPEKMVEEAIEENLTSVRKAV